MPTDSVAVKCLTFCCRYDTNQLWHALVPDDPKEIQFIQLFTKHEMSLISYHEVWRGLHSGACISFHPLVLFLWTYCSLLSSRHFFFFYNRWIKPCLKNIFVQLIGQCYLARSEQAINISGTLQATLHLLICSYTQHGAFSGKCQISPSVTQRHSRMHLV